MKKKILVFAKRHDSEAESVCHEVSQLLKSSGCEVVDFTNSEDRIERNSLDGISFGIVFGGDGTFLTLVRRLEAKDLFPLMGVNLGTLGFITEIGREEIRDVVKRVLEGNFEEDTRPLLDVQLWRDDVCEESGVVFNDAVISKDARASLLDFDVYVDEKLFTQERADGLIVATPTGSTGYALSAGGPLIHPGVRGVLCCPVNSHSLYARPVVVPERAKVEIRLNVFRGVSYLSYDGQIDLELKQGDRVCVRQGDSFLRMVRSPNLTWADALRLKLRMGY